MPKRSSGTARFPEVEKLADDHHPLQPALSEVTISETQLTVTIADATIIGGRQVIDCSRWLIVPRLAADFARALPRIVTKRFKQRTRHTYVRTLSSGFLTFVAGLPGGRDYDLGNVDQPLLDRFHAEICRTQGSDNKTVYRLYTRRHFISALRSMVQALQAMGKLEHDLIVKAIRGKEDTQTAPLAMDVYAKFIATCKNDALAVQSEITLAWTEFESIEQTRRAAFDESEEHRLHPGLHGVLKKYVVLPERKVLKEEDTRSFKTLEIAGYSRVRRALHPMAQDFTAFVYFLACVTLYNAQSLMEIELSDIVVTTILGAPRLSLHPYKTRGRQIQHRSFPITDEADNPANIINFLVRWTDRIRKIAPLEISNRLFIFVPRNRKAELLVRPLYRRDKGLSIEFASSSARYCKEKGFQHMGTRALRTTGADLADGVFEGDPVAVESLLGHVERDSIHPSYRSARARSRDEERLVGAMSERERWIASDGKTDARVEPSNRERTASTPGFRCMDPYNSPIRGERAGRLCSAYGFCPICPLAQPDPDHVYAVARLLQLRQKVNETRELYGVAVWNQRFKAIEVAIASDWLPLLATDDVLDAAGRLHLNPLPRLE